MKYKLTKTTSIHNYTILYQIIALKDFADIKAGDLGGYIESEANLAQDGNCWVFGNTKVSENARVFGDAKVSGNAEVFGDAELCGNAEVSGNAQVFGNAEVHGNAQVFGDLKIQSGRWSQTPFFCQGSQHSIHFAAPDLLAIGCEVHTLKHWFINYEQIAVKNRYSQAVINEYFFYLLAAENYQQTYLKDQLDGSELPSI